MPDLSRPWTMLVPVQPVAPTTRTKGLELFMLEMKWRFVAEERSVAGDPRGSCYIPGGPESASFRRLRNAYRHHAYTACCTISSLETRQE